MVETVFTIGFSLVLLAGTGLVLILFTYWGIVLYNYIREEYCGSNRY